MAAGEQMTPPTWTVEHSGGIKRFVASFPGLDLSDPPEFIELSAQSEREYLRTTTRMGASGGRIRVHRHALRKVPDGETVEFREVSAQRYRWHKLLHDAEQRLALGGLLFTAAGLVIDASLAIGKVAPILIIGEAGIVITMVVSLILKIVGLLLVLWKGVLQGDTEPAK